MDQIKELYQYVINLMVEVLINYKQSDFNRFTNSDKDILKQLKEIYKFLIKSKLAMEDVINEHQQNNYESLIQKLEADIRQHIRIEQQQRLQIETLQQKIDEMQSEHEQEIKQLQTLLENKKFIAINKVQNLNQTNFIIDKGQADNPKKKSPTAFERLSILVKKHKQSKTTSTSEQMLALLKQCKGVDQSQSKGKRLSTLRRENTTKGAFYTHRDDSSSIDKLRKTQSKLRTSQIMQQDDDLKSSSFDGDKKRNYNKFQHLLKQK